MNIEVPQHRGGSNRAELWPQSKWLVKWWKPGKGIRTCSTSDVTWKRKGNMWETPKTLSCCRVQNIQNRNCRPIWTDSIPVFLPDAVENEEKLDEDATKGQYPTHYYTRNRLCEEWLFRDLTGDLVCSHWLLNCLHGSAKRKMTEMMKKEMMTNSSSIITSLTN